MKKLFVAVVVFMIACQRSYHIEITGSNDMGPIFCISHGRKCGDDDGVYLPGVTITLVDDETEETKDIVWSIGCYTEDSSENKKCQIKELAYGHLPDGWVEEVKAKPILPNSYYSVPTKLQYFIKNESGEYKIVDFGLHSK